MSDILFKTDEYVFSYRVAGICIQGGKVLLQTPSGRDEYAFLGGHVAFGETNAQTLEREFEEEIGAKATVGELKWVGEVFFPWGNKPCHQICLYYMVDLDLSQLPKEGMFTVHEHMEGRDFTIEFHWVPLKDIPKLTVYPTNASTLLGQLNGGVKHFIYKE